MSDRFELDESILEGIGAFRLETLPQVEAKKLDPIEKAAIERAVADREDLIQTYQLDTLALRSERNALSSRLSAVESERDRLRERVEELETQRPSMEPRAVFESLGSAFDRAEEDLKGASYRVEDVDFTLKANMVGTADGVRMYLPSVDERSASANLSEVSFRLRAPRHEEERRAESNYVEIPDVTGTRHETAARRLAAAGVDVGDVETVPAADTRPNTVVDQFPEPFTVAPPGAPVDLVIAADPEETDPDDGPEPDEGEAEAAARREQEAEAAARREQEAEAAARREQEAEAAARRERETEAARRERESFQEEVDDEFLDQFRFAISRGEVDDRSAFADRLREADLGGIEALVEADVDRLAKVLDVSADRVEPLHRELVETHGTAELESITGIGPTYAGRLREAGIRTVGELARRDPREVAEATRTSPSRTEGWIEEARSVVAGR